MITTLRFIVQNYLIRLLKNFVGRQVVTGLLFLFLVVAFGIELPFVPFFLRTITFFLHANTADCINLSGAASGFMEGLSKAPDTSLPMWKLILASTIFGIAGSLTYSGICTLHDTVGGHLWRALGWTQYLTQSEFQKTMINQSARSDQLAYFFNQFTTAISRIEHSLGVATVTIVNKNADIGEICSKVTVMESTRLRLDMQRNIETMGHGLQNLKDHVTGQGNGLNTRVISQLEALVSSFSTVQRNLEEKMQEALEGLRQNLANLPIDEMGTVSSTLSNQISALERLLNQSQQSRVEVEETVNTVLSSSMMATVSSSELVNPVAPRQIFEESKETMIGARSAITDTRILQNQSPVEISSFGEPTSVIQGFSDIRATEPATTTTKGIQRFFSQESAEFRTGVFNGKPGFFVTELAPGSVTQSISSVLGSVVSNATSAATAVLTHPLGQLATGHILNRGIYRNPVDRTVPTSGHMVPYQGVNPSTTYRVDPSTGYLIPLTPSSTGIGLGVGDLVTAFGGHPARIAWTAGKWFFNNS